MAAVKTCAGCSAVLPDGALFCGECGRSVSATTAPLDPFPWGLPVASAAPSPEPEPEPAGPVSLPPAPELEPQSPAPAAAPEPVPVAPAPAPPQGERFVLQFSTGESVTVTGTGIVGRHPRPEPGEYFDHVVTIADPGKSVSKTHLEFGQDEGIFWISDRFSGNGSVARDPDGEPRRCDPGKRYRVARGARVEIGDQFFIVS